LSRYYGVINALQLNDFVRADLRAVFDARGISPGGVDRFISMPAVKRRHSRQVVERDSRPFGFHNKPKKYLPAEVIFDPITIYCIEGSQLSEPGVAWKGR
jgi:hypothetical protein